jgi:hypothetical protein
MIQSVHRQKNGILIETMNNTYAFHAVTGDRIRGGTKVDIEGTVTYVGDSLNKHYVRSHDFDEVPQEVIDKVTERGLTVLKDVEGDWASWNGRPEFSNSYVDISDAEPVE